MGAKAEPPFLFVSVFDPMFKHDITISCNVD